MSDSKHVMGRWVIGSAIFLLTCLETFALYCICDSRGFMTWREFSTIAVLLSALHTVLVLPFVKSLLVRLWQVPLVTVALLLPGCHSTNTGRLHYWATMERLHNGMTVAQVRETAAPHWLVQGWYYGESATPEKVAQARRTVGPDFTGKLVCRPLNPRGNDADEDGTVITFQSGFVTDVFTMEGD